MVAEKRPCVAGSVGVGEYLSHPLDKAVFVALVTKDQPPLDAADDDMVQDAGGVETSMAGHGAMISREDGGVKSYLLGYGRPQGCPPLSKGKPL